ncbi:hypothetical protein [Nocardioides convexus]|uniref:hypothetical protein n=1 Tax=Nocardioides convexus TaxID=2712224 RepID=UPI00241882B5|nr:hypothetical protein [Nocardioides convexus]
MAEFAAPTAWIRVTVHSFRTATTVAGLTLLLGFGALGATTTPTPAAPSESVGLSAGPLDDLMQHNRCSVTGFDRTVVPSQAIVRTPEGETESGLLRPRLGRLQRRGRRRAWSRCASARSSPRPPQRPSASPTKRSTRGAIRRQYPLSWSPRSNPPAGGCSKPAT